MDHPNDLLHEAKKLRLLAAVLELQHLTNTAANVMPIPGTGRVIAIGEPAEVARLLEIAPNGGSISVLDALDAVTGADIAQIAAFETERFYLADDVDGLLARRDRKQAALPKAQIADLAARCGIKAGDDRLAEFAALVRDAEPVETLVPVVEANAETHSAAEVEPASKLNAAIQWLRTAQHGDNCFVSDHYEGDPGNRCNCGKDALLDYLESDDAPVEPMAIPAVLFDGMAVYEEVMANDPPTPRPTADNVADVLDAVVRLMRKERAHPSGSPAGMVRAGWFLYEGTEWVATSSDDPRATVLYRRAAQEGGAS